MTDLTPEQRKVTPPPRIYLAARYSRREEMASYAAQLEALGYTVVNHWVENADDTTDDHLEDSEEAQRLAAGYAIGDWDDILIATLCIFFNEEPRTTMSRGGRHVELGLALGERAHRHMDIWAIGPRENVFHCLPAVEMLGTWADALALLAEEWPAQQQEMALGEGTP